jgi:integrase
MPKRSAWSGVVANGIRKYEGPQGQPWYRVQLGTRGKGNRVSKVCHTLREAENKKAEWLAGGLPLPGAPPALETDEDTTVEDQLRLYRVARPQLAHDIRSTASVLARDYPEFLTFRVDAVQPDHFVIFRDRYTASGRLKPSGIRRHLYTLQAAVRMVRSDFYAPPDAFPPPLKRHPQLTPAQLRRACLGLAEPFRTMARVAALSFMRMGELLRLRREHIDFAVGTIQLHRAKAGPRTVPMGKEVAALLKRHLATHPHALVFCQRGDRWRSYAGRPYARHTVWEHWAAAMRAIGRPGFTFHDLRHHAAMTALANGASFPELQALGGWARADMVNRYATASNDRLRALQDLGARPRRRHAGRR